jgi:hypothetical protein
VTTQAQRDYNVRAVRAFARRLRGMTASELPALPYHREGLWWREFVLSALPAGKLQLLDLDTFEALLMGEARCAAGAGYRRSPELLAWLYRWAHGPDAVRVFAREAIERGEMPDTHALWLLLHPEMMPADFPCFVEIR